MQYDQHPPPPPPHPIPSTPLQAASLPRISPRSVADQGPPGAFLISLLIFNGHPFKDHWAYWVQSNTNPDKGVEIHATGDVRNGFHLEIKRCYDFAVDDEFPTKIIPLQWVLAEHFDENAMFNNGVLRFDDQPVCGFELSAWKVKAPAKSLNSASNSGKKIVQRDCQTWVVESADQLVDDGIFAKEVASYLKNIKQ